MTVSGPPHITPRPAPRRILEDASGRRLRRLRWIGRAIAVLFLVWLLIVILGGLGVGPAAHVPFGRLLRPSSGPPPVRHEPQARRPSPADLSPALPASSATPPASTTARTARGKPTSARGRLRVKPARGRSGAAPGQTATTSRGKSGSAPGRSATTPSRAHRATTTTTVTTVSHTTSAPGRTKKP